MVCCSCSCHFQQRSTAVKCQGLKQTASSLRLNLRPTVPCKDPFCSSSVLTVVPRLVASSTPSAAQALLTHITMSDKKLVIEVANCNVKKLDLKVGRREGC